MPERKITVHQFEDVVLSLFQMSAGAVIPRHNHAHTGHTHSTGVARGSTEIEIWSDPPQIFTMHVGDKDFVFDMTTDHEIRALEDDTIVVNLTKTPKPLERAPGADGGIMMEDGNLMEVT